MPVAVTEAPAFMILLRNVPLNDFPPSLIDPDTEHSTGVAVGVGVAVSVGIAVNVGVKVGTFVGNAVGVFVGVWVIVGVAVCVAVAVAVAVGVAVGHVANPEAFVATRVPFRNNRNVFALLGTVTELKNVSLAAAAVTEPVCPVPYISHVNCS